MKHLKNKKIVYNSQSFLFCIHSNINYLRFEVDVSISTLVIKYFFNLLTCA